MRTFLAIELSSEIQDALRKSSDRLRQAMPAETIRWVNPESIHLTLKFLGEIEPEFIQQIEDLAVPIAEQTPMLKVRVGGLGVFPRPSRPRVLWVGVGDQTGALQKLHDQLQSSFETVGMEPERRRFTPHLTLGRVKRGVGKRNLSSISETLSATSVGDLGEMEAAELILFESQLGPGGAIYRAQRRFEFEAG